MIEHEAEIFSRPARTWFQTGKEKAKSEGEVNAVFHFRHSLKRVFVYPLALSKQQYEVGFDAGAKGKAKPSAEVKVREMKPS